MTALRVREALSTPRRRLAILAVLLALVGLVAYHHSEPSDMDGMVVGAVCLAVLGGAAAALAVEVLRLRLPRPPVSQRPGLLFATRPAPVRGIPARAGPLYLRLAVLRR
jgi:hypothetical protein